MRIKATFVLALILSLAVQGCSLFSPQTQTDRTKALLAFGETLDAAGRSFVDAGKLYNSSLDAGTITADQYRKWADFAKKFQAQYPNAKRAWDLARTGNNIASMDQVKTDIGPLIAELAAFSLTIYQTTTKPR